MMNELSWMIPAACFGGYSLVHGFQRLGLAKAARWNASKGITAIVAGLICVLPLVTTLVGMVRHG